MTKPTDPDAVPIETELAKRGGWRLLAMGGVPPIRRKHDGDPDRLRRSWLAFFLPRMGVSNQIAAYAGEMGCM